MGETCRLAGQPPGQLVEAPVHQASFRRRHDGPLPGGHSPLEKVLQLPAVHVVVVASLERDAIGIGGSVRRHAHPGELVDGGEIEGLLGIAGSKP